MLEFGLQSPAPGGNLVPALSILRPRNDENRRRIGDIVVHHVLRGVAEERPQRVEIFLGDRVELVIVTGRAAHRHAKPDSPDRISPILGIDLCVFVLDQARLVGGGVTTLKASRHPLVEGRLRE